MFIRQLHELIFTKGSLHRKFLSIVRRFFSKYSLAILLSHTRLLESRYRTWKMPRAHAITLSTTKNRSKLTGAKFQAPRLYYCNIRFRRYIQKNAKPFSSRAPNINWIECQFFKQKLQLKLNLLKRYILVCIKIPI